jgi:hypothetical protein
MLHAANDTGDCRVADNSVNPAVPGPMTSIRDNANPAVKAAAMVSLRVGYGVAAHADSRTKSTIFSELNPDLLDIEIPLLGRNWSGFVRVYG